MSSFCDGVLILFLTRFCRHSNAHIPDSCYKIGLNTYNMSVHLQYELVSMFYSQNVIKEITEVAECSFLVFYLVCNTWGHGTVVK